MRTKTPLIMTLDMLQLRVNRVCTCSSFFVSKTVREIRAFFLDMTKIQLKRVNHKLSRRTVDAPSTGRAREASNMTLRKVCFSTTKSKKGKIR